MNKDKLINEGELLGYCSRKGGNLYSIETGIDRDGLKMYEIWYIKDNDVRFLIEFTGTI